MKGVEDIYELSPMQHGMLFDSVIASDSGMYLIQLEYFLQGVLRVSEFERAWQQTLDSHGILRTSFHWDGMEKPLQVVHRGVRLSLPYDDWSRLPTDEQERRAASFREADRRRGVDFEEAPLLRLALFRTGTDSYRLLWSFHHILMEGWSAALVLTEVLARYRSITQGEKAPFEEHRPYRDYVAWFQKQDPQRAETYWRNELQGFQSPTHLGIDHSPITVHEPVTEFDEQQIQLSTETTHALQSFVQRYGLTFNTVVQGAWALLLSRYAREEDVVFGTIVSGRSVRLRGVESMVGLFVNLLPTRVRVNPRESLIPWLRRLQDRQVRQREFEYSPLVEIKGLSEVPAGLPLFESVVVFENWSGDLTTSDWGRNLQVRDLRGHLGAPGHPLMVVVVPGPELRVSISYDRHRFDAAPIERMLRNLEVLLDGMVADSDARLAELPLLAAAERDRVLREWNDSRATYPTGPTIHGLFEAQVARTPDTEAVVWGNEALTYGGLDRRANQLAHHLRGLGVRREVLVGVCVSRSLDMVVSLLAVFKAGGTYVPLDPDYPRDRQTFMLEDSGATLVVTQAAYADRLRDGGSGAKVLCLDEAADAIASEPWSAPPSGVSADNLAYVIYTSGSTGHPKGTAIEHRCLVNLLHWARDAYDDDELSGVMLSTSICFDLSTFELFLPLSWGGRVFVAENALDLPNLPRRDEIRLLNSVPSAISALIRAGAIPASVTTINMAGEMLHTDLVGEVYAQGVKRVCDLYGPSETTTYSTYAQRTAGGPETVGHPLANTSIYLLDRTLEPVPEGVAGELCIGGAGVVRGYLNRPDLTAERFVPDPFSGRAGARMYRTGDLARYAPDGSLQLLGRMDHQVKVRGFRIEPGEIEVTLRRHPGLSDVVVMAREDVSGDKRLVAYVVATDSSPPATDDLRAHLRASLPEVMVPGAWVWLDALPRTPNGKLDRTRLPAPERDSRGAEAGLVEPRTRTETTLAAIWQKVLDVDRIGVRDNFFDLGGHSLLLLPIIGELKKELGVRLTAGELVMSTLGQLAALCEERMGSSLPAEPEPAAECTAPDIVRPLIPFYYGPSSRPLFGCYHPPTSSARDCGLILCYPLGHEYIQFHRAFRQLATLLADAGFPVLRFDFYGCGDSEGDHEGWRVDRWIGDIQASIHELRRRAGVSRIGLVGLRLGAALSALVSASRDDIDAMVLWDPVLSGKAYLEELGDLHGSMVRYAHVKPTSAESRQTLGFPMPDPLVADLAEVDLLTLQRKPASRVLVIESNSSVEQEPLRQRLESLGTSVQHQRHFNPHLWVWIEDFGKVHVPHKILQAVVSWACEETV